ncbi:c-type cytochrome [Roseibium litorale]|uniref:Cytochrome c n=1 Tax=Roseibium litorale TaxID=2803841 RepID=A0ABR9CP66_9HYPH|nr:cytochrome c [Roseibium litorale]MBD8892533.1 cytochrome c [Roseibium litorale]
MRLWLIAVMAAPALAGAAFATLHFWPIGKPEVIGNLTGDPGRGAYLARMSGCIACHTNSAEGGKPLAGGVRLPTGFGTFYSPNLTTDPDHGIGNWTIAEFAAALRQGISPEGEPYYPSFPYPFYSSLSDQDIADLWAAFKTVPPVASASKPHDMMPPFNLRAGLKVWRALYYDPEPYTPDPERSDLWNRGKFIVEGPAHCGACHTPRNLLGARQAEMALHGAEKLPDGGKAPPVTRAALLERGWTVNTLKYALQSGIMQDGDVFGGSMAEVVRDGTAFLTDEDRAAMATYLLERDK